MFYPTITFVVILFGNISCNRREEGDKCTLNNAETGECKSLSLCQSAIKEIKERRFPQTCGFKGLMPIVCCPKESVSVPTVPTTTGTKNSTTKANLKCEDFGKYAFSTETINLLTSPTKPVLKNNCDFAATELIVGGSVVKSGEFPHMALLGYEENDDDMSTTLTCGGSLISEQFVLTAASCLHIRDRGSPQYVRLGEQDSISNSDNAQIQNFTIIEAIEHPEYLPESYYNDIALLRLDRPAKLNRQVRPACLHAHFEVSSERAITSGRIKMPPIENPTSLSKHVVTILPPESCNKSTINLKNGFIDSKQICARPSRDQLNFCQGGMSLQVYNENVYCTYAIIGVAPFAKNCNDNNLLRYTRVSHYIQWMESVVWP